MADVYATKTGLWSDTTVWNTSALPTSADDVYAGGFTIYVDTNPIVLSIRNTVVPVAGTSGGTFRPLHNTTITGNVFSYTTACVNFLSAAPNFCTIVGNVSTDNSGGTAGFRCVLNSSSGTINISGNILGGRNSGANAGGQGVVDNQSSGTINISGFVGGSSGVTEAYTVVNWSSGTINIYGNVSGARVATNANYSIKNGRNSGNTESFAGVINIYGNVHGGNVYATILAANIGSVNIYGDVIGNYFGNNGEVIRFLGFGSRLNIFGNIYSTAVLGLYMQNNASVYITGNVVGGSGSNIYGLYAESNSYVNVSGSAIGGTGNTAYGVAMVGNSRALVKKAIGNGWGSGSTGIAGNAPGLYGGFGTFTEVEQIECGARGVWPLAQNVFIKPNKDSTIFCRNSAFDNLLFISALSSNIIPPTSAVRLGSSFNFSNSIGSAAVPSISSVLLNTLVDGGTGIACALPENLWDVNRNNLITNNLSGSIGYRASSATTDNTTQYILSAFKN